MDDILPRYTEQRSLTEIEKESQEIIKRELSRDRSYEFIKSTISLQGTQVL